MMEYYEQLYAHKFDSLDEKDQFLGRYNLPKLAQEKTEKLNRPIFIKEIKSVISNLATKKIPGNVHSLVNSTKHLRKTLYQFFL